MKLKTKTSPPQATVRHEFIHYTKTGNRVTMFIDIPPRGGLGEWHVRWLRPTLTGADWPEYRLWRGQLEKYVSEEAGRPITLTEYDPEPTLARAEAW